MVYVRQQELEFTRVATAMKCDCETWPPRLTHVQGSCCVVAQLRNYARSLRRRSRVDEGRERTENLPDFSRMLQAVSGAHFGVAVVAHNLGEAQRGQCMADARQAPAQRPRKLARAHLVVLQQQLDDGEGDRIAKHAAQSRLPVALFFHADPFITFVEFLKPRPLSGPILPSCAIAQVRNMPIHEKGRRICCL